MKFVKLLFVSFLAASIVGSNVAKASQKVQNFEHYLSWEYGTSVDPKSLKEDFKLRITFQSVNGKSYLLLSMNEALRNRMPEELRGKLDYYGTFYHYASDPEALKWQGFNKISSDEEAKNRLGDEKTNPQVLTINDAAALISGVDVIFYTGFGISSSTSSTNTAEIERSLDLKSAPDKDKSHHVIEVAIKLLSNPDQYLKMYEKAIRRTSIQKPTDAHWAIAKMTKSPVLTENYDNLHQQTSVETLSAKDLKDKTRLSSMLRNVEYLITVGLVYDESGVLKLFKDVNKQGKIIAFGDRKPYYLSADDYFVPGDVQQTIPALKRHLR